MNQFFCFYSTVFYKKKSPNTFQYQRENLTELTYPYEHQCRGKLLLTVKYLCYRKDQISANIIQKQHSCLAYDWFKFFRRISTSIIVVFFFWKKKNGFKEGWVFDQVCWKLHDFIKLTVWHVTWPEEFVLFWHQASRKLESQNKLYECTVNHQIGIHFWTEY